MENENIPVFYVIVYRQSNTARTNVKIISKIMKTFMKTVRQNIFSHVPKITYMWLL